MHIVNIWFLFSTFVKSRIFAEFADVKPSEFFFTHFVMANWNVIAYWHVECVVYCIATYVAMVWPEGENYWYCILLHVEEIQNRLPR